MAMGKALDSSSAATTIAANKAAQLSAASLAGANMTATWALAPWPIDAGAVGMGATTFAGAMAFEQGGLIPGAGAVPIIGHGGETVVTKALTDRVESAERNGGSSGTSITNNFGDAHVEGGVDAKQFEKALQRHSKTLERHVRTTIKKLSR